MEEITKETNLTSSTPTGTPAPTIPPVKKSRPSLVVIVTLLLVGVLLIGTGIFVYSGLTKPTTNSSSTKTPTPTINTDPTITTIPSEFYIGEISPVVPHKGLKFKEIDIHNFKPLDASLSDSDFEENGSVYDGYTFTATKGEDFEFLAEEKKDPAASFIKTELYGYGPTVIKMDTRIGWGVPATGRYFYVVKGSDLYGNTPANKFGNYTLSITQRK